MTVETDLNCPLHGKTVKIVAGRGVPRGAIGVVNWARVAQPYNEAEAAKWDARNSAMVAEGKTPLYGWRVGLDVIETGERVWTFAHNLEMV